MEQNNTRENTEMGGVINATEAFIEENKKLLTGAIIAVVVVVLAVLGVVRLNNSRNEKANTDMFAAEQYFAMSQYDLALNGDMNHSGLLDVAKKYGCTRSGQRAKYEAGLCYLYTGDYASAVSTLKSYKPKDKMTRLLKEVNLGSAELELGNTAKAHGHFGKVINKAENFEEVLTHALFLNGMAYLMEGDKAKANEMFKAVKQHPSCTEARTIDQYIGLTE